VNVELDLIKDLVEAKKDLELQLFAIAHAYEKVLGYYADRQALDITTNGINEMSLDARKAAAAVLGRVTAISKSINDHLNTINKISQLESFNLKGRP